PSLVLDEFRRASTGGKDAPAAPPKPAIPAMERILLKAMALNASIRGEFLPALRVDWTVGFITRDIFEALRHMSQDEDSTGFSALEDGLSPPSKVLLHDAITADEPEDEENLREQVQACLRRLESDARKRQLDELRSKVKEAERGGKVQEAFEW